MQVCGNPKTTVKKSWEAQAGEERYIGLTDKQ